MHIFSADRKFMCSLSQSYKMAESRQEFSLASWLALVSISQNDFEDIPLGSYNMVWYGCSIHRGLKMSV